MVSMLQIDYTSSTSMTIEFTCPRYGSCWTLRIVMQGFGRTNRSLGLICACPELPHNKTSTSFLRGQRLMSTTASLAIFYRMVMMQSLAVTSRTLFKSSYYPRNLPRILLRTYAMAPNQSVPPVSFPSTPTGIRWSEGNG